MDKTSDSSSSSSSSSSKKKKKKSKKSKKSKKNKASKKVKREPDGAAETPAQTRKRERAEATAAKAAAKKTSDALKLANDVSSKVLGPLTSLKGHTSRPEYAGMPTIISDQVNSSCRELQNLYDEAQRTIISRGSTFMTSCTSVKDIAATVSTAKRVDSLLSGMIAQCERMQQVRT